MHARRAAQRGDAHAGIVGERRQFRERARVPRLGQRVLDERRVRLVRIRDAEVRLRHDVDPARRQQAAEFAQLALVAGRQHQAGDQRAQRRPSAPRRAARCRPRASATSASISRARERRAFGRPLQFDEAAGARHHDVHVGVAVRVLGVVEVEHRHAVDDAHRHRGDVVAQRLAGHEALGLAPRDRVGHRDARAGDRRAARAAVRLQHVAIDLQRALAQRRQVDDRAQAAADQPLDFLRAAGLLALGRFAPHPRVGRARQHPVLGGQPALPLAFEERRHAFLDADRAQHVRVAHRDQHRAFRVLA